jgi:putative IMPACT (imprinted ancient) family translation regulator
VVRYSGGIKLGTGGLVKAYGGGVQQALSLIETETVVASGECLLEFDYAHTSQVEQLLERYQAIKVDTQFSDVALMRIRIAKNDYSELKQQLINVSSGQINLGKLLS